jgi:hypothetical protein
MNGNIDGMCFLDNPIMQEVYSVVDCYNKLEAFAKEKITFLERKLLEQQKINALTNDALSIKPIPQPTPSQKTIKPIQLDMEQRQIIYLFQKLIDESFLNENKNPTVWDLVAQYFTDKDNNPLKNIHQNKDGLKNTKTGKPKKNATEIENIITETKNSL